MWAAVGCRGTPDARSRRFVGILSFAWIPLARCLILRYSHLVTLKADVDLAVNVVLLGLILLPEVVNVWLRFRRYCTIYPTKWTDSSSW